MLLHLGDVFRIPLVLIRGLAIVTSGSLIVGVDEVGRGACFGPIITCAASFPVEGLPPAILSMLADSKTLKAKKREAAAAALRSVPGFRYALGAASVQEVDRLNPLRADMLAMQRALLKLSRKCLIGQVLVDGIDVPEVAWPCEAIIKGDGKVPEISAASILAKVFRDRLVVRMARRYPGYMLEKHKGYGTAAHFDAVRSLGPSDQHRLTFLGNVLPKAA